MKRILYAYVGILGLAIVATGAVAKDFACLMEGSAGTMRVKDCIHTNELSETELKKMCDGLSKTAEALGATAAKITYLSSCPAGYQASCKGLFGKPITAYYYEHDPLIDLPNGCVMLGGAFK